MTYTCEKIINLCTPRISFERRGNRNTNNNSRALHCFYTGPGAQSKLARCAVGVGLS